MKLSIIWLIVCFLLIPFSSISQNSKDNFLSLKEFKISKSNTQSLLFFCRKSNEEPELTSQQPWLKSILLTTTNDTLKVEARYLSQKDEIEILLGNDPYILFQEKVQAIAIGNQVYRQLEYPYKDQLYLGYFEIISEGNISFLKKGKDYYLKTEEHPVKKIKHSKKELYKLAKTQQKEIDSYMRSNRLNPKKEKDFLQLLYYINDDKRLSLE